MNQQSSQDKSERYFFQVADRMKYPTIISIVGNSFLLTSFLFIGPASFFQNLVPSINLTYGMAAMLGVGNGLVLVSSAARVYKVGDSY